MIPAAAFHAAMRLIGCELHARTCATGALALSRFGRNLPITGHPISGWQPTTTQEVAR